MAESDYRLKRAADCTPEELEQRVRDAHEQGRQFGMAIARALGVTIDPSDLPPIGESGAAVRQMVDRPSSEPAHAAQVRKRFRLGLWKAAQR